MALTTSIIKTIENHGANTSNPHSTSIANIGTGTLAQLNSAISDADVSNANHTHTFASLTAKPTTLAGYGVTDYGGLGSYTPTLTSSLGWNTLAASGAFRYEWSRVSATKIAVRVRGRFTGNRTLAATVMTISLPITPDTTVALYGIASTVGGIWSATSQDRGGGPVLFSGSNASLGMNFASTTGTGTDVIVSFDYLGNQ